MFMKTLLSGSLVLILTLTAPLPASPPKTVLILPGLACPAETTTVIQASFSEGQQVLVLDWTARMLSGSPEPEENKKPMDFVLETLDSLPEQDITLIGHSMGGWLALQAASLRPERVQHLIILDAAPFPAGLYQDLTPGQALMVAQQTGTLIRNMSPGAYQTFNRQRIGMMITDPTWQEKLTGALTALPQEDMARLMEEMTASDLRPELARIRASTLVLASSRMATLSGQTPTAFGDRLAQQYAGLSGCRIRATDQAGHFLMLEAPDWVQQKVQTFLEAL